MERKIVDLISEFKKLDEQKQEVSRRMDEIKACFEKWSEDTLTDSKLKSSDYVCEIGSMNVSNSATIKVISGELLKRMFGEVAKDFCTTKETVELNSKIKPILSAIYLGEYIDRSPDDVITEMTIDNKLQALLKKKLKGDYKKDIKRIVDILGVNETDAEFYAYMFAEATIYDKFKMYMSAAGLTVPQGLEILKSAITVDESIKATFKSA